MVKRIRLNFALYVNYMSCYTECPTRYRTRHFFNNSNTNEDIATKFEQEYVRCVRNGKECVCSAPNCYDTEQRSASQPGSVASGTLYISFSRTHTKSEYMKITHCLCPTIQWVSGTYPGRKSDGACS